MRKDLGDIRSQRLVEVVHANELADRPISEPRRTGPEDVAGIHQ